jgi:hypothetical protein
MNPVTKHLFSVFLNENKKNEPADATQPSENSELEAKIEEQPIEPNQEL